MLGTSRLRLRPSSVNKHPRAQFGQFRQFTIQAIQAIQATQGLGRIDRYLWAASSPNKLLPSYPKPNKSRWSF